MLKLYKVPVQTCDKFTFIASNGSLPVMEDSDSTFFVKCMAVKKLEAIFLKLKHLFIPARKRQCLIPCKHPFLAVRLAVSNFFTVKCT